MARAPQPGKVKTRLLSALNESDACQLHKDLVELCLQKTINGKWVSHLCCTDVTAPFFLACEKTYGIGLRLQCGDDLGSRMQHVARQALHDFDYVILIGADCPVIDADYISQAQNILRQGADAVIGPAEDGGYVLLGLSKLDDSLFNNIEWGGEDVLAVTRQRLQTLGWQWQELATLWDVDRPDDYVRLLETVPAYSMGVSSVFPQSDHEPG